MRRAIWSGEVDGGGIGREGRRRRGCAARVEAAARPGPAVPGQRSAGGTGTSFGPWGSHELEGDCVGCSDRGQGLAWERGLDQAEFQGGAVVLVRAAPCGLAQDAQSTQTFSYPYTRVIQFWCQASLKHDHKHIQAHWLTRLCRKSSRYTPGKKARMPLAGAPRHQVERVDRLDASAS